MILNEQLNVIPNKEAPRFVFPEEYKTHSEVYTLKGAKQ